mmetsp:Transcript_50757/g.159042  ORF Transcript_50757/g.159042 Transcript_50757/m.159042 type:complete len:281 (+) Transcript_50757:1066-1908(+)
MSSMPPARRSIACFRAFCIAAPALFCSAARPCSVVAASQTLFLWLNAPAKSPLNSSFMPGSSEAPVAIPAPKAPKTSPLSVSIAEDAAPRYPCSCSLPELPMRLSSVLHMAPESLSDLSAASDVSRRSRSCSDPPSPQGRARLLSAAVSWLSSIHAVSGLKTPEGGQPPKRLRLERASGVTSLRTSSLPSAGCSAGSWKRSYCTWRRILDAGATAAPSSPSPLAGTSRSSSSSRSSPQPQDSAGTTTRPTLPKWAPVRMFACCTSTCSRQTSSPAPTSGV